MNEGEGTPKEYIEGMNEAQKVIYEESMKSAEAIYDKIIHSLTIEQAEAIAAVLKSGDIEKINELTEGLIDIFGKN